MVTGRQIAAQRAIDKQRAATLALAHSLEQFTERWLA
jgi:hypothetical protein